MGCWVENCRIKKKKKFIKFNFFFYTHPNVYVPPIWAHTSPNTNKTDFVPENMFPEEEFPESVKIEFDDSMLDDI